MNPVRLTSFLALFSLVLAGFWMARISYIDPWYRNTDMNIHNTADALAINSGLPPNHIDQPGVPMKYLLALDFRIRHSLGLLSVWNLKEFGLSPDPLREIPKLIRIGRVHSRILVLVFIVAAGCLVYTITTSREAAGLAVILLCGCLPLLFHGLFTRPELLCVVFGNIIALLCVWKSVLATQRPQKHGWLLLAGIFCGLSTLEKLPGICFLPFCFAGCCIGALTSPQTSSKNTQEIASSESRFWDGLLPAGCSVSVLWLLFYLESYPNVLSHVAIFRLRLVAVVIAVTPIIALWHGSSRIWRFLQSRTIEAAVLGGGALLSLFLIYLCMRAVMSDITAADYMTRMIHYLFDPASTMKTLLDSSDTTLVLLQYFQQNPFLFISTPILVLGILFVRQVPLRIKALITLVLLGAFGIALVMSNRHFTLHYSIFPQVPLLLVWALSLSGLSNCILNRNKSTPAIKWGHSAVAFLAFTFVLTAYPPLKQRYQNYQNDATLPVNDLTLTFLFDHDAHTATYLQIMRDHYGNRDEFKKLLEQFLNDPQNRY